MAVCPMCREAHWRLGRSSVLGSMAAAPRRLAAAVRGVSGGRLTRRPAPTEWSVVEVLAHLLDAEITLGFRIRKAAAEPGTALVAWDQDKWAAGLNHRRAGARTLLATFTALRADTLALLRRLRPAQRRAAGTHPEYGRLRVDQLLDHWAEHDLNHLAQIRTTLARR
jgi:uncharacterized damage-inducible protein DinB